MSRKATVISALISIAIVGGLCCGCAGSGPAGNSSDNSPRAVVSVSGEGTSSLYDLADEGYEQLAAGDNVFCAVDAEDLFKFLEHGTGVLFLGYPECPWCQRYVALLDEAAKETGIDKVVYYNTRISRTEDPDSYAKLLSMLDERGDFTEYNDEGDKRIFVPFLAVVDDGKIVFADNDTSHLSADDISPDDYWTADTIASWKEKVAEPLDNAKEAMDKCQECSD